MVLYLIDFRPEEVRKAFRVACVEAHFECLDLDKADEDRVNRMLVDADFGNMLSGSSQQYGPNRSNYRPY